MTATGTPPDWPSRLDAVVVHAAGAVCRRLARGTLPPAGGSAVRLTGLPRTLDGDSLRATVLEGPPGLRVAEVRRAAEARLRPRPELPELRRLLAAAERHEAALRLSRERLAGRITETAGLRPVAPPRHRAEPHRRTPADAWLALAGFLDDRLTALHTRAAELDERLAAATHERELLADRLARGSDAAPATPVETSAVALVTLAGADTGTDAPVLLELEYRVPGALWVPGYQLDHRPGEAGSTLLLRAAVAQRTGEDWTGVRLSLSTADLHRPTEPPKLRSIRIGRRQSAPPPSGWREPPAGLDGLFAGYDAAGRPTAPVSAALPVAAGPATPTPRRRTAPGPAQPVAYGVAAAPPAPGGRTPHVMRAMAANAPSGPPPAPTGPSTPPEPPEPAADLLDYAALTLAGPAEPPARRGRLHPAGALPADDTATTRQAGQLPDRLPLPAHAVRPRHSAGSFDQRHDTADRVDLPSDGQWHTVPVGELPVSHRTEYVCAPSVDPAVFATLRLTNESELALLAGPLEVTEDGVPLLGTALPTLAPGATRRVGLGVAESVRATRRTGTRESTAGLRGSTTVLEQHVHVELANRLGHPVTVEVRERVPLAADKEIRIEELPGSPAWTTPDEATRAAEGLPAGTRLWRVELPAGGRATLDGGHEIRIPAGRALTGGNRRN
ncbi:DUF4139 domain-containing protein [Kitasatospora sp. NPDC052896]|uniref:DUF4139 domain-containing protein n=1 Tax=Kitasatospora sp. NPDC052896 TaxID=3364061 RepID=UPI0037CC095D